MKYQERDGRHNLEFISNGLPFSVDFASLKLAPSTADPAAGHRPDRHDGADEGSGADPDAFKAVMRHHAKGVAIITAGVETPVGFCATSLASLSLRPALVSFAVGLEASSCATVLTARHVVVHLLADEQEELARRFGTCADPAKFGPQTRWHRGAHGLPVLDDVLAWMVVTPMTRLLAGDHWLLIGQVVTTSQGGRCGPLIHHNGEFVRLGRQAGNRP